MPLFTVAEARAFEVHGEKPLADTTKHTDAEITAAEERINERFREITGVAFAPTSATETLDGSGNRDLRVTHFLISDVTAVTIDGVALSAAEVDAVKVDLGHWLVRDAGWPRGRLNVTVDYVHGHPAATKAIKWAGLVVAVEELVGSDITSRATSQTDELGTFRLAVAGRGDSWYGIPAVDSVLLTEREHHGHDALPIGG